MNAPASALSLTDLAYAWLAAKADEDSAIANRRQIGELIAAALPGAPEGTVTQELGDLKIGVTRSLSRSVDSDTLATDWANLPMPVQAAFKWKAGIDVKQLRALESVAPDLYALAARFVTAKPAAPTVTIKEA